MNQATVTASSVNVRSGPSTSKKWLGRLEKGETFSYSNDKNGWLQTVYQNQTAYVCKKYTTTTSASTSAAPATTSATPASSTPATSSSVSINVSAAVSYNEKRGYSSDKWKKIQAQIGVTTTGTPDEETAIGVAEWQKSKGLKVDGKCGPNTLSTMDLSSTAAPATTTTTPETTTPAPATTTPAPETTTPAPATTTPAPAPATTTTTSTPTVKILSSSKVKAAIDYNNKQHLESIWTQIQDLVGVDQTGLVDEITVQAIAAWQKSKGLTADGKFGNKSMEKSGLSKPSATTTTTPPATTTTPATTTPATTTPATTTPETTTPAPTTTTTANLLNAKQVSAAIDYSIKNYLPAIWRDIQKTVGTAQTNQVDEISVQAIAAWQNDNGLEADGKFGTKSLQKAGLKKPSGTLAYGTTGPGGLVYADNNYVRKYQDPSTEKEVVDLKTGRKFKIFWHAPKNSYHSDVNPLDKPSTDTFKSFVNENVSPEDTDYWSKGSNWSWAGRPGALKLNSNTWIACGYHTRPHGSRQGGNPDYPFTKSSDNDRPQASKDLKGNPKASEDAWKPGGHFCLYYNKDNRGGTDGCKDAVEQAKFMQSPE